TLVLGDYDYVYGVFPGGEGARGPAVRSRCDRLAAVICRPLPGPVARRRAVCRIPKILDQACMTPVCLTDGTCRTRESYTYPCRPHHGATRFGCTRPTLLVRQSESRAEGIPCPHNPQ